MYAMILLATLFAQEAVQEAKHEIIYGGTNRLLTIIPNLLIFFGIIFLVMEVRSLRTDLGKLMERLGEKGS